MFRLLFFFLAGYILYKLFTGGRVHQQHEQEKADRKRAAAGEMVKDPVCGAFVPVDGDIRVRDGGTVHHFCSYECRDAFLKRLDKDRSGRSDS